MGKVTNTGPFIVLVVVPIGLYEGLGVERLREKHRPKEKEFGNVDSPFRNLRGAKYS